MGNVATIPFGGTFVVTGILDIGCEVQETFFIDQSPYYLPDVEYDPNPPTFVQTIQRLFRLFRTLMKTSLDTHGRKTGKD